MAGLKIITYQVLFALILFIKPGSEICFSKGSVIIVDFGHLAPEINAVEKDHNCHHNELEQTKKTGHNCCIDFKSTDIHSGDIVKNELKHFDSISQPIPIQAFIVVLNSQFYFGRQGKDAIPINQLTYLNHNFYLPYHINSAYQFTTTVSLLI